MLRQWEVVEAKFASDYGLSIEEVLDITWRRFRVLFSGVFNWEEAETEPKRIADMIDWSSAEHKPVIPDPSPSAASKFAGTRVPVGSKK